MSEAKSPEVPPASTTRKNIWARNGGIYLGYKAKGLLGEPPPLTPDNMITYQDDRHVVTLGPNGSGKSRRLLEKNLRRLTGWSMLVIDPKGELADLTAEPRRAAGNNIIYLDPYALSGQESSGFNPIMALDPTSDEFTDDALGLADAVIKISPDTREPHWAESAQDLVCALIMFARLTAIHPDPKTGKITRRGNFAFVRQCLGETKKGFKKVVEEMIKCATVHKCEELAIKAKRWVGVSSGNQELGSILSTAVTQTRWLDSRNIKRDLEKVPIINRQRFNFEQLKDAEKPTTVYLILPARHLATMSPWLRLIIASAIQRLMRDVGEAKNPTMLVCDEIAQLGHLSAIENNLALMRGYSLKLWAVFQDLSQAQAIYGKRWESFMGNAGVLNAFAPQDVVTADYLSTRTGIDFEPIKTYNDSSTVTNAEAPGGAVTYAQLQRPLLYPQELRSMDDGFMVYFGHRVKGTRRCYVPFD